MRVQVLVTGASGFVGAALSAKLLALGHTVRALVGPHSALAPAIAAQARAVPGDLGDPNGLRDAAEGCQLLFHCAGENARDASAAAFSWINVAGTENTLRAARAADVARVVVVSCADVTLVNRHRVHWKESAALGQAPLGGYARSKLLAEELALQASDSRMVVTALRPALLWGPGERTLLPQLCREGLAGGLHLFGRGDNLFSTCHVDNLVDAAIIAARAPAESVAAQAFHIADPDYLTAREFFTKLSTALGLPPPRRGNHALAFTTALIRERMRLPGPRSDQIAQRSRSCLLDCLRAATALDFQPTTTVDQGMTALAQWAQHIGGPTAIANLTRPPADSNDIARHQRLAEDAD